MWTSADRALVTVVHRSGGGAEAQDDVGDRLCKLRTVILPFKLNQGRRHHFPRQQRRVTNWPAYDASLRQRGSLTMWFTDEAIAAWAAKARTTRGRQARYSPLAILTALTLRAVFRLAYRQAEGLLGSIVGLLGLDLRVPDHTTLSRRAATLDVPRPGNAGADAGSEPLNLLVDSTGLKLCGKGEWLLEKHGTATRRSWHMLQAHVDALFDRGLISFQDSGMLLVSPRLGSANLSRLGLGTHLRLGQLQPRHLLYLAHHRREIFKA